MRKKSENNFLVLGIDPGIARTGYGLVYKNNSEYVSVGYGLIKTSKNNEFSERLYILYENIVQIIQNYKPDVVALELLFFNKNVKTAFSVGEARGVIALASRQANLGIFQYTPLQVKQAVVGYGMADKVQVQNMLKILLKKEVFPETDDVADALAIAICHLNSMQLADVKAKG